MIIPNRLGSPGVAGAGAGGGGGATPIVKTPMPIRPVLKPCAVKKYRISANYQIPGYRTQVECTRANGQTYKNIETMSGEYAWDEDIPGAELVPGKGKATATVDGEIACEAEITFALGAKKDE